MPTVIRSTITRTVRAQTQTQGVRVSVSARCHKPGGARGGESTELVRGREAQSQCEGERAATEECISPERRTLEQIRGRASLFS